MVQLDSVRMNHKTLAKVALARLQAKAEKISKTSLKDKAEETIHNLKREHQLTKQKLNRQVTI